MIAFLGLGNMGRPMAARVLRQFPVTVWNRSPGRSAELEAAGALVARTPRECVQDAKFVILVLSDRAALEQVLEGPDGVLAGIAPGAIAIEMSTAGRASALWAAKRLAEKGARFVDAPVSGTVAPAERGELVAMVGAAPEDLAACEPVLMTMCRRIIHAGAVGQGQALKVTLNGIGAHHFVAFGSMLILGERAGLERQTLIEAFTSGAFASPSYVGKAKKVLAQEYSPEFALALTKKDAALTAELQGEVGLALPVFDAIREEIARAVASGIGEEDLFAIEKYFAAKPRS
jgi:3-hydroxyisobutyrate dehydrogenase